MKSLLVAVGLCLLAGILGYGVGYVIYEPKIIQYKGRVADLTYKVAVLGQNLSERETQLSVSEAEKTNLQGKVAALSQTVYTKELQILGLNSDKSKLEQDLSTTQAEARKYESQLASSVSQLTTAQNRLDKVLGVTVTQNYQWDYRGSNWKWELPIPMSLYDEYLERPRPRLGGLYVDMARDPKDDPYIDVLLQQINNASTKSGISGLGKVNFVVAFVQSLPYTSDAETTPYNEYPRYPIETLFDRGGDCEDTSILAAAMLDKMGYDVALLLLRNAKHMAVGISLDGYYGSYYDYSGKKYFYLETTGDGWQIGQIPPDLTDKSAEIYPLK